MSQGWDLCFAVGNGGSNSALKAALEGAHLFLAGEKREVEVAILFVELGVLESCEGKIVGESLEAAIEKRRLFGEGAVFFAENFNLRCQTLTGELGLFEFEFKLNELALEL